MTLQRLVFLLLFLSVPHLVHGQHATALMHEGDSLYELKRYDDAIFSYVRCADASTREGDRAMAANAYERISGIYQQTGNYIKSLDFGAKALNLFEELDETPARARMLSSMGTSYYYLGQTAKAIDFYGRSLELRRAMADSVAMADMLLNLGSVHSLNADFISAMEHYTEANDIRRLLGDDKGLAQGLNNIGTILREQGRYAQSIDHYTEGLRLREKLHDTLGMVSSLVNIGTIYQVQNYLDEALENYKRSLELLQAIDDDRYMGTVTNNIGSVHQLKGEPETALLWLNRSSDIMQRAGNRSGYAATLATIGDVLRESGRIGEAKDHLYRSLVIRREIGDRKGIPSAMMGLAKTELAAGNGAMALTMADSALTEATAVGAITVMEEASNMLYKLYRDRSQESMAFKMLELNITLKDSLRNQENQRTLMRFQFQADFDRKEAERLAEQERKDAVMTEQMSRKALQRNVSYGGLCLMMAVAAMFFVQRNRIAKEKQRSESLLLNILPETTARELKDKGAATPRLHVNATVLFTDFVGFTEVADKLSAKDLVLMLDSYFRAYDQVVRKHGLEKIKTIGDAYMAASGLGPDNEQAAIKAVQAAIEMTEETHRLDLQNGGGFQVRIGIHTGPVVAGVVGDHKFQYDIWGDTVNIASRMESAGEPGKVNISHATYQQVSEVFSCTPRGELPVKGKGSMRMYFVDGSIS